MKSSNKNIIFSSFLTAVLSKEKGFNEPTIYFVNINKPNIIKKIGAIFKGDYNSKDDRYISLPELSHLQKWFRDKHGINVIANLDNTLNWIFTIQSMYPEASYTGKYIISNNSYSTYEEALDSGLKLTLTLI